jgi:hypothetical protein
MPWRRRRLQKAAIYKLKPPRGLALSPIANLLMFGVPRHHTLTNETTMPIKAAMAAYNAERLSGIGGWGFKLRPAMAAVMPWAAQLGHDRGIRTEWWIA